MTYCNEKNSTIIISAEFHENFPTVGLKQCPLAKSRLLIMKFFNLLRLVIDAAVSRHRAASYSINRAAGTYGKVGPDKFFHVLIREVQIMPNP